MKNIGIKVFTLSLLTVVQACKLNNIVEPDPIFQEKKRPLENKIIMNKVKQNESDYQEVNKTFLGDYENANKQKNDDIFMQKKTEPTMEPKIPFAIQRIRQESVNQPATPRFEQNTMPPEPMTSTPREYTPITQPQAQIQPTQQTQTLVTNAETFEIQAGSYQSEVGAMKVVQKLESGGVKNIRIDKVDGKNTVRINNNGQPFKTREEASKMLQDIIEKTQHYDIMVVKNKI